MFSGRIRRASRTLGFRLTASYITLFVASNLVMCILSYHIVHSAIRHHDRENLLDELHEYAGEYNQNGIDRVRSRAGFEVRSDGTAALFIRVIDAHGQVVLNNAPDQWSRFDLGRIDNPDDTSSGGFLVIPSRENGVDLEIFSTKLSDGSLISVGRSSEDREDILRSVARLFCLTIIPLVFIGLVGGRFLAKNALQSVRELLTALRSVLATRQFTTRVPIRGTGDELDALSGLFNDLLDRITVLISGMKNSLDNVAHDLRTPMTRFRATAELALREDDAPVLRDALANCIEESDRILSALRTLMDISEAEAGVMKLRLDRVPVLPVVQRAISLYENVADEKGISVASEVAPELSAEIDPDRMLQVIANLLDNALKYSPVGANVTIVATQQESSVDITVRDSGIGIPADEIRIIFDRLYRSDRSRHERGLGLGLSLVRAVVEAHQGTVMVESRPNFGSQFKIQLPCVRNASSP